MNISEFKINDDKKFKLSELKTHYDYDEKINSKEQLEMLLEKNIIKIAELQSKLYAQGEYGVLVIIQAMDAAGKDGVIKHVMSGLNPQATQVTRFKEPSAEDLNHDYLWKAHKNIPERGEIGIFNRSYYEELLVVRVHNLLKNEKIPSEFITDDIWEKRARQIKDFERYLYENGIIPIKIFLNVSKEEQKRRLLERIEDKSKNWKFSEADIREREYWDDYQHYYEKVIRETSTKNVPWYVVPADNKKFARLIISRILENRLEELNLEYPILSEGQYKILEKYRNKLVD